MQAHILVVDDDPTLCAIAEAELARQSHRVTACTSPDAALARLAENDVDVVLTDLNMPTLSGLDLCARIVASNHELPVVVMTAFGTMDAAVGAMRAGAYDFVTKPLDPTDLALTLGRATKESALRREARRLRYAIATGAPPEVVGDEMVGSSPVMAGVFAMLDRVAAGDTTVLVTGESGTGKELVARAVHARSPRAAGPIVAINCAALPEGLLESEFFGHTRGAFTDAHQAKAGLFVKAAGGTLFLDEIGEMPMAIQAKLLRALQERRVRPVGAETEVPFDARVVAATNVDLEAAVAAKVFREDLFYRINVVRIDLPPLRARGRDVLDIAAEVLRACGRREPAFAGFTTAALDALQSYPWPGNVRELQNAVEYAATLAQYDQIGLEDLPPAIRDFKRGGGRARDAMPEEEGLSAMITFRELERRHIAHVLKVVHGNKTVAARILGFDRRTLYRKLDAFARASRAHAA